jgi:uncharacterized YigZ family protein
MQPDTYLGINRLYSSEFKSGGSKFLGFLFPVDTPDEYEQKIKAYKTEYADATHVCSGCVLGLERDYQRCSDDGEPSNSSGRPILNALLSNEITNVGCAVVRYYGGKKLGIPGLIEAYGGAAALCIESAQLKTLVLSKQITCTIPPEVAYKLYNYLSKQADYSYTQSSDGKFIITCAQSMTDCLLEDLKIIPNLAIDLK